MNNNRTQQQKDSKVTKRNTTNRNSTSQRRIFKRSNTIRATLVPRLHALAQMFRKIPPQTDSLTTLLIEKLNWILKLLPILHHT